MPSSVGEIYAEGPPVPFPNTEVKLCRAYNTCMETCREDGYSPTPTASQETEVLFFRTFGDGEAAFGLWGGDVVRVSWFGCFGP